MTDLEERPLKMLTGRNSRFVEGSVVIPDRDLIRAEVFLVKCNRPLDYEICLR